MAFEKTKQECNSNCQDKPDSHKMKQKKEPNVQTKVVIRRLPPSMTEDQFVDQISPMPENDYFYFHKAESNGLNCFSRAYINFLFPDEIFIFKEKFDNYVFLDHKGAEYNAVVEFAPFQKIPKIKGKKKDKLNGTIDMDPDYLQFLESLKEEETVQSPESNLESIEAKEKASAETTPLIEYLKAKKVEQQKVREEKREERKKKDAEKRKNKEELGKKKKLEKDRTKDKKDLDKETEQPYEEPTADPPLENVTVLKNPEREKIKELPTVPKTSSQLSNNSGYTSNFKAKPKSKKDWSSSHKENRVQGAASLLKKLESKLVEKKVEVKKRIAIPVSKAEETPKVEDEDEDDDSKGSADHSHKEEESKDPRTERRIRNKFRPTMEIYKPGIRRLARNSSQQETSTSASNSSTPSPTPQASTTAPSTSSKISPE